MPLLLPFAALLIAGDLNVGSLSVDGLEVRELHCTMENVNFLSGMQTVAALSARKADFDACAPEGAAFTVKWTWGDKGTSNVAVVSSSKPAANACVQKALVKASSDLRGSCDAMILAGDPTAAAAAAATLRPAP